MSIFSPVRSEIEIVKVFLLNKVKDLKIWLYHNTKNNDKKDYEELSHSRKSWSDEKNINCSLSQLKMTVCACAYVGNEQISDFGNKYLITYWQ